MIQATPGDSSFTPDKFPKVQRASRVRKEIEGSGETWDPLGLGDPRDLLVKPATIEALQDFQEHQGWQDHAFFGT